jgi:TonB family protein
MIQKGAIAIISVLLASAASAQHVSGAAGAKVSDAEAERLAELAYIAQELGVPVPLSQNGPFDQRPGDYPPELWAQGHEGRAGIAVPVDRTGRPTACRITESSGHPALDAKTCELVLARARFQPALDPGGDPVAGEYLGSYSWRIRPPYLPGSHALSIAYTITAAGEVVDCKVIEAHGELLANHRERLATQPCPQTSFIDGRVFRDENGNPVAKRVTVTSSVTLSDPAASADRR